MLIYVAITGILFAARLSCCLPLDTVPLFFGSTLVAAFFTVPAAFLTGLAAVLPKLGSLKLILEWTLQLTRGVM